MGVIPCRLFAITKRFTPPHPDTNITCFSVPEAKQQVLHKMASFDIYYNYVAVTLIHIFEFANDHITVSK